MLKPTGGPDDQPTDSPSRNPHLWDIAAVRDLGWIALSGALLWFVYSLRGVFTPVIIALALAYLVNPLVHHAERRWRMPRPLSAALTLIAVAAGAAGLIAWLGPLLTEQVHMLAARMPQYLQRLSDRYNLPMAVSEQIKTLMERVQDDPLSVIRPLFMGTTQAFGMIGQVIGTTTQVVLLVILIPIYFFFFAWHFDRMKHRVVELIPVSTRPRFLEIVRQMDRAVSGFFRGRLLIAVITSVLFSLGWKLTDVPYWFLLGTATGFLNIIPYASLIGWPLAILLKYLDAAIGSGGDSMDWISIVIWPTVPYLLIQLVESWMLTPWIQSWALDLSALTILLVVFIGGAAGGFYGLLLAIPTAACIKILFRELVLPRWKRWAAYH